MTRLLSVLIVMVGACVTGRAEAPNGPSAYSGECSWVVQFVDGGCLAVVSSSVAEPSPSDPAAFDVHQGVGRSFGGCGEHFTACGATLTCRCQTR